MSDYKESEKIPNELEAVFQFYLWHQSHLAAETLSKETPYEPSSNPEHTGTVLLHQLLKALAQYFDQTQAVVSGAKQKMDYDTLQGLLRRWDTRLQLEMTKYDPKCIIPPYGINMAILRSKLARIQVIRETNFLLLSYSLFDVVLAFIVVLLVTTPYPKSELSGYVMCSFFTYLFVYLRLKVRALDNPFSYSAGANQAMLRTGRVEPQRLCEISFDIIFCNLARQMEPYLPPAYLRAHRAEENDDVGAFLGALEDKAAAEAANARAKAAAKAEAAKAEKAEAAGKAEAEAAPKAEAAGAAAVGGGAGSEAQQLETVVLVRPPTQGPRLRTKAGEGE
jgi:hypothetical protein